MFKIIQDPLTVNSVCRKCGGFGMFPCPFCDGSKKSGHRNNFNLMALKEGCSGVISADTCSGVISADAGNKLESHECLHVQ